MTTISCFLTIKYELSNTLSHVCLKNTEKLRIHAQLTQSGRYYTDWNIYSKEFQFLFWFLYQVITECHIETVRQLPTRYKKRPQGPFSKSIESKCGVEKWHRLFCYEISFSRVVYSNVQSFCCYQICRKAIHYRKEKFHCWIFILNE